MFSTYNNPLLATDVYKLGHMEQYPKGTTKVYSYIHARSSRKYNEFVWFGLNIILKTYLNKPITIENVDELLHYRGRILGSNPLEVVQKLTALAKLGYIPLEIRSVPEGTVMTPGHVIATVTNTHPDFAWLVGYFESLLLKVWNPCTVTALSRKYYNLVKEFADYTCDNHDHVPFAVHDFGYRGTSSEETAAIAGSAHLIHFLGTDTVPAVALWDQVYNTENTPIGLSVPASEHSVMCAFGRDHEIDAFQNMLDLYPTGIVSIVSDTYNVWNVLWNFTEVLRDRILNRDGKVVFRPDSGDPIKVICGDPSADYGSLAHKGALQILWEKFGGTINSKGYKVLNPKVGLIYGDGMYFDRYQEMLQTMAEQGFAASNLVIGVGGILLQSHSRDDLGFAIKATYVEVDGASREIMKDPVTDPGKKSRMGFMKLTKNEFGYVTTDHITEEESYEGLLELVYQDGQILREYTLQEIRDRALS